MIGGHKFICVFSAFSIYAYEHKFTHISMFARYYLVQNIYQYKAFGLTKVYIYFVNIFSIHK